MDDVLNATVAASLTDGYNGTSEMTAWYVGGDKSQIDGGL